MPEEILPIDEDFDLSEIEPFLSDLQKNTENAFCVTFNRTDENEDEADEHPGIELIQRISDCKINRPIQLMVNFPSRPLLQALEGFFTRKCWPRRSSLELEGYTLKRENMFGILAALKDCGNFTLTFSDCPVTPGFFQALKESSQSFPEGLTLIFLADADGSLIGWDADAVFSLAETIKNLKSSGFSLEFNNFILQHDKEDNLLEHPREISHQVFQAYGSHIRFLVEAAIENSHVKELKIDLWSSEAETLGKLLLKPHRQDLNLEVNICARSKHFEEDWRYFLKALALPHTCLRHLITNVNGVLIIKSLYTNKSLQYFNISTIVDSAEDLFKNLLWVNYDLVDDSQENFIKRYRESDQKEAALTLEDKAWLPFKEQMGIRSVREELMKVGLPLTISHICCELLELTLPTMAYLTDEDISLQTNLWRSGVLAWRYSLSDSKHFGGVSLGEALADCFAYTLKMARGPHFILRILSQLFPLGMWSRKTGIQQEYMLHVADEKTLETVVKPLLESLDMDIFGMGLKYLVTSVRLSQATQINLIAFFCIKESLRQEKLIPLLSSLSLPFIGQTIEIPSGQYNIFWVISLACLWQGKDNFKRFTRIYHSLFGKKGQVFSGEAKEGISVNNKSLQRMVCDMLSGPLLQLFEDALVNDLICRIFRKKFLAHGRKYFTEATAVKMGYSNWAVYEKATESSFFQGGETEILWSSTLLDRNFKIFSKHYCYELGLAKDPPHQPIKLGESDSGNRYCLIVKEEKQGHLGKRKELEDRSSQLSTRQRSL